MSDLTPWVATCGLICLWPLFFGVMGFLIGSRRLRSPIRIQNPLKKEQSDAVGYAPRHGGR